MFTLFRLITASLNSLMARVIGQFEFFRSDLHNYPDDNFKGTTTKLIDIEQSAQFQQDFAVERNTLLLFITRIWKPL